MQYIWLAMSALVIISSTIMGFKDGFDKWWMMYLFLFATVIQYYRHKIQYRKMAAPKLDETTK